MTKQSDNQQPDKQVSKSKTRELKPQKPLSKPAIVLCIIGFLFGLFLICLALASFGGTKPHNPHSYGFGGELQLPLIRFGFIVGVFASVVITTFLLLLIFKSRSTKPRTAIVIVTAVLLPCIMICGLFFEYKKAVKTYYSYSDPTFSYEGAEYTYYTRITTTLTGLSSDSDVPEKLVLPEVIKGHDTDVIDEGAFRDLENVTEVVLPDSIQTIKEDAFRGCTSLKKVTLGESIRHIEKNAFKDCVSLCEINEPESSSTENALGWTVIYTCKIDKTAFDGCPNAPEWTRDPKYLAEEEEEED